MRGGGRHVCVCVCVRSYCHGDMASQLCLLPVPFQFSSDWLKTKCPTSDWLMSNFTTKSLTYDWLRTNFEVGSDCVFPEHCGSGNRTREDEGRTEG